MEARRGVNDGVSDAPVLCSVADGVATVTLNRPDRMNAWTYAMEVAYFDLVDALDDDPDVRAVVLTGAGRGFCPGLDAGDGIWRQRMTATGPAPGSSSRCPRRAQW